MERTGIGVVTEEDVTVEDGRGCGSPAAPLKKAYAAMGKKGS